MNKKAKYIILKTKKEVFGSLSGNNISALKGEGFEFAELREYAFGDDVKKIDWKTTAKLGKPYVKIHHEERELNVVVSTLLSGSTFFGTSRVKKEYIIELMAILGYSAIKNRDLLLIFYLLINSIGTLNLLKKFLLLIKRLKRL